MIRPAKSGAVVYVKDLHRMRDFYTGVFRMGTVEETGDYCVMETEILILSLVLVPAHIAARITRSDPPSPRKDAAIKLAFWVDSIEEVRRVIPELGGSLDPSSTQWEFRGGVHCDGFDPEGNVFQIVEPA
jgi:predicted enzyme related to lactoylglutathione lyase